MRAETVNADLWSDRLLEHSGDEEDGSSAGAPWIGVGEEPAEDMDGLAASRHDVKTRSPLSCCSQIET